MRGETERTPMAKALQSGHFLLRALTPSLLAIQHRQRKIAICIANTNAGGGADWWMAIPLTAVL